MDRLYLITFYNCFLYLICLSQILLTNGLVPTLIKSLAEYVTKNGRAHDKNTVVPDPPAGSVSPSSSGLSPQSRVGGHWSPISDDCSPPSSPVSVYSPLCISEDELEATPNLTDDDINMTLEAEVQKVSEYYYIKYFL